MDFIKLNSTSVDESFWAFKGKTDYVDTWPIMGTPYLIMIILGSYIAFMTKLGPLYMKNRSAYKLDKIIITYNVVQVLLSCFLMYRCGSFVYRHGILHKKCVMCSSEDEKYFALRTGYYAVLAKISELLDTFFFVLRKKQNQVSFLHVYHHTVTLGILWIGEKYEQNENFLFTGMLNCGVHVIMYSYYGLSAFPALKKYLWWKKYITKIQLVQFLLMVIHLIACQFISDCFHSKELLCLALFNILFFYYLFNNFYNESYMKPKKTRSYEDLNDDGNHYENQIDEKNTFNARCNSENSNKKR